MKGYAKGYNMCQRVGRSSHQDEIPLKLVCALYICEKWAVDFIGPINLPTHHSHARYIITTMEYLTKWAEVAVVKDYTMNIATRFIFGNIISRFRYPRSLTINQGTHFTNKRVASLLKNFMIQHHKSSMY